MLVYQRVPLLGTFRSRYILDLPKVVRKQIQHIPQMGVKNGDESHGRIRKKSPTKQTRKICTVYCWTPEILYVLKNEWSQTVQKKCEPDSRAAFPDLLLLPAINAPLVVSPIWPTRWRWGHPNGWMKKKRTLPETNISPENRPLEKEIPIGNHHF